MASTNFSCLLCEYVGKDKQTIYRHYTGKHKVVEQYLSEDIASGRVETLAQKQAKEAAAQQHAAAVTLAATAAAEEAANSTSVIHITCHHCCNFGHHENTTEL